MLILSVSVWAMLALIVLAMAVYRKMLASKEDDCMHLADAEVRMIDAQNVLSQKLEVIDKWGKLLTIVIVASGLIIAGSVLYQGWLEASKG